MKIKSTFSTNKITLDAFNQVKRELDSSAKLIMFFASTNYDFRELTTLFHEHFKGSEVLGITTTGEITPQGFNEFSLAATSFSGADVRAKGVLMEDIEKYPVFYKGNLSKALREVGIDPNSYGSTQNGMGFVFPNGLISAEEKMLSIVNSLFKNEGFPLFGGTAGDNAKFVETLVSYNGNTSSKGGLVAFLKSDSDFAVHKENIFQSSGKSMKITKANPEERTIYEINGRKASAEYARLLGVSESSLPNYFMSNPLGRKINDELWIASPFQVLPNGGIQFYCQIFQDSVVYLLEPKPAIETLQESVEQFKNKFQHIEGVVAVNCILRKLQFENQKIVSVLNKELQKLPNLCGFSSYGEQLDKNQLNQTLILLGFGKKK
ncbi:FIST signal transduction protein [Bacillus thuringiensis]|uniref:FIST signal transduction protein n=1 Tax=Bacillus thuringiensis TaxID=1428 RepID=UPI0021D67A48|nr:FIST N-terminal domain-containing protein [Bacillus thuringiensis]MCU7667389.1 FIST C-terminal domain-containing protein [Bacillus thuringiensis]